MQFLNENIDTVAETKFLGITLSTTRRFDNHIQLSILPKLRQMYRLFYNIKNYINKETKVVLFNSFIVPQILYAVPFINICHQISFGKLSRTYNHLLRILFELPRRFPTSMLPQTTGLRNLSSLVSMHTNIYSYLIFTNQLPNLITKHFKTTKRSNFILKPHMNDISIHNNIAIQWNKLTSDTKHAASKHLFKKTL